MKMATSCSRRNLLAVGALGGGALLAGCDRKSATAAPSGAGASSDWSKGKGGARMLVYRDPECGCCETWADIARAEGYAVTVENRSDMPAVKARHGVPAELASCHTAIVGGYAIEGHVPMRHVAKLLIDKPQGIRGIAVPGMPRGSPGMEMPDGSVDAFEVMAFGSDGKIVEFSA